MAPSNHFTYETQLQDPALWDWDDDNVQKSRSLDFTVGPLSCLRLRLQRDSAINYRKLKSTWEWKESSLIFLLLRYVDLVFECHQIMFFKRISKSCSSERALLFPLSKDDQSQLLEPTAAARHRFFFHVGHSLYAELRGATFRDVCLVGHDLHSLY